MGEYYYQIVRMVDLSTDEAGMRSGQKRRIAEMGGQRGKKIYLASEDRGYGCECPEKTPKSVKR